MDSYREGEIVRSYDINQYINNPNANKPMRTPHFFEKNQLNTGVINEAKTSNKINDIGKIIYELNHPVVHSPPANVIQYPKRDDRN